MAFKNQIKIFTQKKECAQGKHHYHQTFDLIQV